MPGLIVIPAYNEAQSLPWVLGRMREARPPEDVLVIDDGSRDGTEALLRGMGQRCLRHEVNLGYAAAIHSGLRFALGGGYEYVVTLDGDGQHDPRAVPRLTEALGRGEAEVVIGSRFLSGGPGYEVPLGRRLGTRVLSAATGLFLERRIRDPTSGFRAIGRRAFQPLLELTLGDFHLEALLLCVMLGLRVAEVPVPAAPRRAGRSMYGAIDAVAYPLRTCAALVHIAWSHREIRRRFAGP